MAIKLKPYIILDGTKIYLVFWKLYGHSKLKFDSTSDQSKKSGSIKWCSRLLKDVNFGNSVEGVLVKV
jgi:hypothetical protein